MQNQDVVTPARNAGAQITNITQLREHLLATAADLRDGHIGLDQAAVTAKIADSVISSCKTEIAYAAALDVFPEIPFLGVSRTSKAVSGKSNTNLLDNGSSFPSEE
jgi:hypothetical protein